MNIDKVNVYKIAMMHNVTSSINAKEHGIQCKNKHFIQVMPLNNHSITHK
jgi:hypothetical protein